MARAKSGVNPWPVNSLNLVLAVSLASHAFAQDVKTPDLTELSLEDLAEIEVTSFSRHPEPLADAPASLFVITAEDIRRSGVTTLAEALRLAPNLLVARVDAGQYAISARGFNAVVANKLLVLIDGRTIYTPLFSGVFWDQQDVLLEDVERIEIISGPRAAMWGANAVNGVINVITRPARDTRGVLVSVGGGNRQQGAALRYGRALGARGHIRLYGKATHVEPTERANGTALLNARLWLQGGFRADWGDARDAFTLQGDAHKVRSEDRGVVAGFQLGRVELSGMNLLARWNRQLGQRSDLRVQAYADQGDRRDAVLFQPDAKVFDVEVQHGLALGSHRLTWGAGYRHGRDEVEDGILVGFRPTGRRLNWTNVFAQAEVRLSAAVDLVAGAKLERNDFTGWEYLPGVRLVWKPAGGHMVWSAATRAVRAPARLDRDAITPAGTVIGGPNFVSEVANVLQLGYRGRAAGVVTWSVTAYHHDWDRLRSGTALPVMLENRIEGPAFGLEAWSSWHPRRSFRLSGGFNLLGKRLRLEPGSTDPVGINNPNLANDPESQFLLRASLNPWTRHELDALARRVGALPNPSVPAYTAVDLRYGWTFRPGLELWVLGQNLFDRRHGEFGAARDRSEFERAAYLGLRWSR